MRDDSDHLRGAGSTDTLSLKPSKDKAAVVVTSTPSTAVATTSNATDVVSTVTDADDIVLSESSSAQVNGDGEEEEEEEEEEENTNTNEESQEQEPEDENNGSNKPLDNDTTKVEYETVHKSEVVNNSDGSSNESSSAGEEDRMIGQEEQQASLEEIIEAQQQHQRQQQTQKQKQHASSTNHKAAAASIARLQAVRQSSDAAAAAGLAGLAAIASGASPSNSTAPFSFRNGAGGGGGGGSGWLPSTSVSLPPATMAAQRAAGLLQQQQKISQPTPQTLLYTVGFGIDPRQSSLDATEAAVRALRDAMERSTVRLPPTNPNNACPFQIHVKIGVPARKDLLTRLEPMIVDMARIGSILPRSIPILPIDIVVGGLAVSGHDDPDVSICAAVACVTIQTNAAWERASAAAAAVAAAQQQQQQQQQQAAAAAAAATIAAAAQQKQQATTNAQPQGHLGHQQELIPPQQHHGDPSPWEIVVERQQKQQQQYQQQQLNKALQQQQQQPRKPVGRSNSMDMLASISAQIRERATTLQGRLPSSTNDMVVGAEGLINKKRQHQQLSSATAVAEISGADGTMDGEDEHYKKLPPGKTAKNNRRQFVKHNYHDHSLEQPTPMEENPLYVTRGKSNGTAFPIKLHDMLSEIEADGYSYIISWLYHGRSFKIHQQQEFLDIVLPNYFVMTKKSSFLRQLNLYGFNRLSAGPDKGSYYHELFLRNMPFLCRRMTRMKVNGNGIRAAGNPDNEPDFHNMPIVPRTFQSEGHRQLALRNYNELMQQRQLEQRLLDEEEEEDQYQQELAEEQEVRPKRRRSSAAKKIEVTAELMQAYDEPSPQSVDGDHVQAATGRSSASVSPVHVASDAAASSSPNTTLSIAADNMMAPISSQQISFPMKLQTMLDKLESDGDHTDIISWLSHGRGFIVHRPNAFVKELMPVYFKQTKYSSFQRQLHMYSFQRITSGRDKGAYYNENFLRGKPQLCLKMTRTRINGKGCRKPGNPNTEPNLYAYKPLPEIKRGTKVEIPQDTSILGQIIAQSMNNNNNNGNNNE